MTLPKASIATNRSTLTARAEEGFALIELLVAIVLLTLGMLAVVASMDASRRFVSEGERREVATHVGQRAMEELTATPFDGLGMTPAPTSADHSSDPDHPFFRIDASDGLFQWNPTDAASREIFAPVAAGTRAGPCGASADCLESSWQDNSTSTRLTGRVYRFVTWVDDPNVTNDRDTTLAGDQNYKRVTVAVVVDGQTKLKPIWLTLLSTPAGV